MRTRITKYPITLSVILLLSVVGCDNPTTSPWDNPNMVDGGSWYVTGFRWAHDGKPYETENFVVYSDGASQQARRMLAELGEELLGELKEKFGITDNGTFVFPPGRTKIHIYTYKHYFPQQWGGWAYYGGLLIYSLDHKERGLAGHTSLDMYVPVVKHELTHVVESLLKASGNPNLVDVWLTEGIAEVVSGGTAAAQVTDLAKLNDLISTYGQLNPIAMHQYRYPKIKDIGYNYYYPMFQLAASYLFDADGHGSTWPDLKDLLLDVRSGVAFSAAFEDRLGISLDEYEDRFFELMNTYLR